MRIEIFSFRPGQDGQLELDPNDRVAKLEITGGKVRFQFYDPKREKRLREVFENDVSFFVGGGSAGGVFADAYKSVPALSDEAVFHLLKWVLPMELSLCGAIVEP